MKIKEQTRKLAAGYSKHCFAVVDRTDEVSSKHCFEVADGRCRGLKRFLKSMKRKGGWSLYQPPFEYDIIS